MIKSFTKESLSLPRLAINIFILSNCSWCHMLYVSYNVKQPYAKQIKPQPCFSCKYVSFPFGNILFYSRAMHTHTSWHHAFRY